MWEFKKENWKQFWKQAIKTNEYFFLNCNFELRVLEPLLCAPYNQH